MRIFGEDAGGHDVLRNFSLVVANSGGSIVAASLAVDQRLSEIAAFVLDPVRRNRGSVPTWTERYFPWIARLLPVPRYTTAGKSANLLRELGERSLQELRAWPGRDEELPDLLILGFNYDSERASFFRTNTTSPAASRVSSVPDTATLLDAVNASTTAPVAFYDAPAHVEGPSGTNRYWDGAIAGYNNPVMAGVVEALAAGVRHDQIGVLSLGTATLRRPLRLDASPNDARFATRAKASWFGDVKKFASAIVDDPPDAATYVAHVTLGGELPRGEATVAGGPVVRMSPVIRPVWDAQTCDWVWPPALDREQWEKLTKLDMATTAQDDLLLIDALASKWLEGEVPNQPIRPDEHLNAEIGHDTFPPALESAKKLLSGSARFEGARHAAS
jgi:hypothetical protein